MGIKKRINNIIILPDVHLNEEGYHSSYALVRKFIAAFEPDEIILLGDFMDCVSLCHWNENKRITMENKRWLKECDMANKELDFLQKYSDKVTYLEGNHERWSYDYAERHPEMQGYVEVPIRLNLKARNIDWHTMNTLYQIGDIYFTHGIYINKYHSHKHLERLGCNICYGHSHNSQTFQINMKMQSPFMAYGLGCLCGHSPRYMKNKPCNWINQFAVCYSDNKTGFFNLIPVNIIDDSFIWNGRLFK